MKFFFADQQNKFSIFLRQLCSAPVSVYNLQELREKRTEIEICTSRELAEIDLGFLYDYRIFPSSIMNYLAEWTAENRNMRVGDTILQQINLPPFPNFSQKIIFGVRIKEVINEPKRRGFSYETLEGHVERGVSTFTLEERGSNKIVFVIHTFSKPATFIAKSASYIFSLPYQKYCTGRALRHVKQQLESCH